MRVNSISKILAGGLMVVAGLSAWAGQASAITGADFVPGHIIDDQVFYDPTAMTVSQVQSFLDSLVPTCDTNGNEPYYGTYKGVTYNGNILRKNLDPAYPPPYTCMEDYYENPTTNANNIGDPSNIPAGAISAAQIIVNAAVTYNINPEVLITLIEKESLGSLPTDDWPWPNEYDYVTGYACPDNGGCSTAYEGFYDQVTNAARQFNLYTQHPDSYNYSIGENSILYHPAPSSCGSESVNIVNQATANLYDYTPYVPDQAALNNLYGLGDSCSSYGNRNFWRIFNDWFGSTYGGSPVSTTMELTSPVTMSPTNPIPGQTVTVSYTVENTGSSSETVASTVTQCRINQTANCDPTYGGSQTINAGSSKSFSDTFVVQAGTYDFTPYFLDSASNTWYRYLSATAGADSLAAVVPAYVANMALVGPITSTPANPIPGQTVTISYTAKNPSSTEPAIIQNTVIQCRLNTTTNCDPAWNGPVTIAAGASQVFSNTFVVRAGGYVFTPYFEQNGTWWVMGYGTASTNQLSVSVPAYVADMQLTSPVSASPANPIPGQSVTVSYTVQNDGTEPAIYENSVLQCRLNTTAVCDPPWNAPVTINAGDSHTFSNTFVVQAGTYLFSPFYEQNEAWYKYGLGPEPANTLTVPVPAYVADLQLIGPITSSPAAPTRGQSATISYTVKNLGTEPAILQNSVLQCRLNATTVCDPAWNGPVTIAAGAEQSFSNTFTMASGSYWFTPYFMQNNDWYKFANDAATFTGNALPLSVP